MYWNEETLVGSITSGKINSNMRCIEINGKEYKDAYVMDKQ